VSVPARDGHYGVTELEGPAIGGLRFHLLCLLAPNLFATLGIFAAYTYAYLTHTDFKTGTYVLFAVLCGAASYIAVPAVQRLAIPKRARRCTGRVTGSDVLLQRHHRDPAVHRDRPSCRALVPGH